MFIGYTPMPLLYLRSNSVFTLFTCHIRLLKWKMNVFCYSCSRALALIKLWIWWSSNLNSKQKITTNVLLSKETLCTERFESCVGSYGLIVCIWHIRFKTLSHLCTALALWNLETFTLQWYILYSWIYKSTERRFNASWRHMG